MPHENKFPGRVHAENELSVQTKFDSPHPLQNQIVDGPLTMRSKDPKLV